MAFPTAVNSQITDSVTQANVQVVGEAPAMAMGSLYQSMAQSISLASQNAVTIQQNTNTLSQAVLTKCVKSLVG